MEIKLAKSAGFCFGVKRAVDMVNDEVEKGSSAIYTSFTTSSLCMIGP